MSTSISDVLKISDVLALLLDLVLHFLLNFGLETASSSESGSEDKEVLALSLLEILTFAVCCGEGGMTPSAECTGLHVHYFLNFFSDQLIVNCHILAVEWKHVLYEFSFLYYLVIKFI